MSAGRCVKGRNETRSIACDGSRATSVIALYRRGGAAWSNSQLSGNRTGAADACGVRTGITGEVLDGGGRVTWSLAQNPADLINLSRVTRRQVRLPEGRKA